MHHPGFTLHEEGEAGDGAIVRSLRQAAWALAESIPAKIADAPLNQIVSALKTTVELLRMLEPPDEAAQEQVVRWEFVYDGEVHDAPPWATDGAGQPGAIPPGGLRASLGQDGVGQDDAA